MSGKEKDTKKTRVDCFSCIHHKITWQPATPYACTALGFKSKLMPSLEVFKSSGEACKYYTVKNKKGGQNV